MENKEGRQRKLDWKARFSLQDETLKQIIIMRTNYYHNKFIT